MIPPRRTPRAKLAERVLEVLEYFDEHHPRARVMDIVRRYGRPQSSTSDLLTSLTDLGLLYKDLGSPYFVLTPRAAIMGAIAQPRVLRDGTLANLIDGLSGETGLTVALVGMVGPNAQMYRLKRAFSSSAKIDGPYSRSDGLCSPGAGHLLLSTLPPKKCDGLIHRFSAEGHHGQKLGAADLKKLIEIARHEGVAHGPAGFGLDGSSISILLPRESHEPPLAIGCIFESLKKDALRELPDILRKWARRCYASAENSPEMRRAA